MMRKLVWMFFIRPYRWCSQVIIFWYGNKVILPSRLKSQTDRIREATDEFDPCFLLDSQILEFSTPFQRREYQIWITNHRRRMHEKTL